MGHPLIFTTPEAEDRLTPAQRAAEKARSAKGDASATPRLTWTITLDRESIELDRDSFSAERRDRLAEIIASLAYLATAEATCHVAAWRQALHSGEVRRLFGKLKSLLAEGPAVASPAPATPASERKSRRGR